ncbi:glycosyltransferase family 9 protein [Vibrio metschnikovii]|nr:glycosyltransferase family 9 protein [Vibrio metschnikovii]EKO3624903.1 glycosyltransferase family 9 protein [Vibrio metschnikovii]EKO3704453.1 glycosyltransferase family 9 protein [Vibrio metschnikovii]
MKKILVIRNDKIGDFMLAWPSFAMLKTAMPNCHVTALVPRYTEALAKLCPWIDEVLIDPTKNGSPEQKKQCLQAIKAHHFDASINLFSTTYNALLVWKAGIPYRLAPATKLAQIFYNKRIKQQRSQSAKPEYQYNLDLIRAFLQDIGQPIVEPQAPYLQFEPALIAKQKQKLAEQLNLNTNQPWLFVHVGSGGSANNLSLSQYAQLLLGIQGEKEIILTAGPGEEAKAAQLKALLEQQGATPALYDKNDGLVDFTRSIACADLFIAGSTGPLHIAATLDVPTVGFFPAKRSSTPLRWQPLNSSGRHMAFTPPPSESKQAQADMSRIDIDQVLVELNPWVVQFGF